MILPTAILKEFKLLARDIHGVAVLFLMPIAFMFIMSLALSHADSAPQPKSLALIGDAAANRDFLARLQTANIPVQHYPADALPDRQATLQRGEHDILLINPNPPERALSEESPLQLWVKPSADPAWLAAVQGQLQRHYSETRLARHLASQHILLPNAAMSAQANAQLAAISQAIATHLQQSTWQIHYASRQGERTRPDSVQHSVPAWLIFGMFFIMIPLSNVMNSEHANNTLTRLRMAQAPAGKLLAAKLIPYFLINFLQFAGMLALGRFILPLVDLPALRLDGALWLYLAIAIATSLAALGYGLLISVSAKSTEHAVVLGGGGIIIMAALGGIMVPVHVMPAFMQHIAQLSPMGWALSALQNLMLNHVAFADIALPLSLLCGFGLLALWLAKRRYHHQLTAQARF